MAYRGVGAAAYGGLRRVRTEEVGLVVEQDPRTLAEVSDRTLVEAFGDPTFEKGRAYAGAGRVTSVTVSDGGAWASARVIGSGPRIYRTELSLRHDDRGWAATGSGSTDWPRPRAASPPSGAPKPSTHVT